MARIMRNEGSMVPNAVIILPRIPRKDGDIDSKDTRCRLGYGEQVNEIFFGYPVPFGHNLVFYKWYHGIAASNGKCSDFEEDGERFDIYIHI